jgi:phosphate/sulfate permease
VPATINFAPAGPIALSWVVSPFVAGILAAAQFLLTRLFVLDNNFITRRIHSKPFFRAIIMAPFFYAFVGAWPAQAAAAAAVTTVVVPLGGGAC